MLRPWLRGAAQPGLRLLLRGDRHECPCCGSTFARFVPRDESLLCARCRSRERQRVLWLYLRDEMGIEHARSRVLHLAPEPALHRRLRAITTLRYETGDLAPGPLVDRTFDIQRLPYGDGELDLILCSHVLEHVTDDIQAAHEFARVLAPGGVALVQVPVDGQLEATYEDASITDRHARRAAFGQADHVRVYATDVIDRLRAGGLAVTCIPYAERLPPTLRFRCALDERGPRPGTDIYRCAALIGARQRGV